MQRPLASKGRRSQPGLNSALRRLVGAACLVAALMTSAGAKSLESHHDFQECVLAPLECRRLSVNEVTGTIPTELGLLTALESLNFGAERLTGTLPTEMGRLTLLETWDTRGNHLVGTIPSEAGLMILLESFRLENNLLTGSLPSELGTLVTEGNLRVMTVHDNSMLCGAIPDHLPLRKKLDDEHWTETDSTLNTQLGFKRCTRAEDRSSAVLRSPPFESHDRRFDPCTQSEAQRRSALLQLRLGATSKKQKDPRRVHVGATPRPALQGARLKPRTKFVVGRRLLMTAARAADYLDRKLTCAKDLRSSQYTREDSHGEQVAYTKDPCFDRNATQHMLSTSLPAVWGHELKRRGRSKAERVAVAEAHAEYVRHLCRAPPARTEAAHVEKAIESQRLACAVVEAFAGALGTKADSRGHSDEVMPEHFYLTTSHFPEMMVLMPDDKYLRQGACHSHYGGHYRRQKGTPYLTGSVLYSRLMQFDHMHHTARQSIG